MRERGSGSGGGGSEREGGGEGGTEGVRDFAAKVHICV